MTNANENTGWNLSDFDTAGWEALEPRAGARVVKVYGARGLR